MARDVAAHAGTSTTSGSIWRARALVAPAGRLCAMLSTEGTLWWSTTCTGILLRLYL